MSYPLLRRLLFRLDPETAHGLAIRFLRAWPRGSAAGTDRRATDATHPLRQSLFGVDFPNPIGLAAGFDKNGEAVRAWPWMGFGFGEVGTVTPLPQAGNPRPRLFRHCDTESLQNAMGFNNAGMEVLARRLHEVYPFSLPIGINIGKNRVTSPECAEQDYRLLLSRLSELGDFFVINISSPNTPGLRDLQNRRTVTSLLQAARELTGRPVLLKISPDLEDRAAVDLGATAIEAGAAGVVVANTTTDYRLQPGAQPVGGLSGRVLRDRSRALLQCLAAELFGRTVLVSVGGIDSAAEVYRRLRAGASLTQLYSALVFHGPGLVTRIGRDLVDLLVRDGVDRVDEVIGADLPASVGRRVSAGQASSVAAASPTTPDPTEEEVR